jgi:hypothetical protein
VASKVIVRESIVLETDKNMTVGEHFMSKMRIKRCQLVGVERTRSC